MLPHSYINKLVSSPLVKNSMVYIVSDGISRAIPFLLLPVISRYMTPSDYGILTNYNVLTVILGTIIYDCSAGVIPVMYYKLSKEEMSIYISNMVFFNTLATLLCVIPIILFTGTLSEWLSLTQTIVLSTVVLAWFTSFMNTIKILWRCEEKPFSFGVFNISYSAFSALTTILFVVMLLMGWQGRVYSQLGVSILMGIFSAYLIYKKGYFTWKMSRTYIKSIALFAIPILPHALALWAKGGADKIMLTNMCNLTDNGLYSVAITWGGIVSMVLTAYSNSYSPYLIKKMTMFDKDKIGTLKEQIKIVKVILVSMVIIIIAVILMHAVSYVLIGFIYPNSYWDSRRYLPWVMASQAFTGFYQLFVCFSHYTFNTKALGIMTFTISALQVVTTYFFILYFGAIGVAYTTALGSLVMFVSVAIYGMHVYKLPWFYHFMNYDKS